MRLPAVIGALWLSLSFVILRLQGVRSDDESRHSNEPEGEDFLSEWSLWSRCSRTCGTGIQFRGRRCNSDRSPCTKYPRQHQTCNTQPCSIRSENFRDVQCAENDSRNIKYNGKKAKWKSLRRGRSSCVLFCYPVGQRVSYYFGRAKDGTECSESPRGVCVFGKCTPVGCNDKLGSRLKHDKCQVCGGDGSTCEPHGALIERDITIEDSKGGYAELFTIPKRATSILISEITESYLAIKSHSGEWIVNGERKVSKPGLRRMGGLDVKYSRLPDNRTEAIMIMGPTQQELYVMGLLVHGASPLVEYEYWLPKERPTLVYPTTRFSTLQAKLAKGRAISESPLTTGGLSTEQTVFTNRPTRYLSILEINKEKQRPTQATEQLAGEVPTADQEDSVLDTVTLITTKPIVPAKYVDRVKENVRFTDAKGLEKDNEEKIVARTLSTKEFDFQIRPKTSAAPSATESLQISETPEPPTQVERVLPADVRRHKIKTVAGSGKVLRSTEKLATSFPTTASVIGPVELTNATYHPFRVTITEKEMQWNSREDAMEDATQAVKHKTEAPAVTWNLAATTSLKREQARKANFSKTPTKVLPSSREEEGHRTTGHRIVVPETTFPSTKTFLSTLKHSEATEKQLTNAPITEPSFASTVTSSDPVVTISSTTVTTHLPVFTPWTAAYESLHTKYSRRTTSSARSSEAEPLFTVSTTEAIPDTVSTSAGGPVSSIAEPSTTTNPSTTAEPVSTLSQSMPSRIEDIVPTGNSTTTGIALSTVLSTTYERPASTASSATTGKPKSTASFTTTGKPVSTASSTTTRKSISTASFTTTGKPVSLASSSATGRLVSTASSTTTRKPVPFASSTKTEKPVSIASTTTTGKPVSTASPTTTTGKRVSTASPTTTGKPFSTASSTTTEKPMSTASSTKPGKSVYTASSTTTGKPVSTASSTTLWKSVYTTNSTTTRKPVSLASSTTTGRLVSTASPTRTRKSVSTASSTTARKPLSTANSTTTEKPVSPVFSSTTGKSVSTASFTRTGKPASLVSSDTTWKPVSLASSTKTGRLASTASSTTTGKLASTASSTKTGRPVSTASTSTTGKPVSTASTTTTGKSVSTASSTKTGKPVSTASFTTTGKPVSLTSSSSTGRLVSTASSTTTRKPVSTASPTTTGKPVSTASSTTTEKPMPTASSTKPGKSVSTASSTTTGKPVSTASPTTTGRPVSTASSATTGKPVTLASSSTTASCTTTEKPMSTASSTKPGKSVSTASSTTTGKPVSTASPTTTGRPVSTASSTTTGIPVSSASSTTTGRPVSTASSTTTGIPVSTASSTTTGKPVSTASPTTTGIPVSTTSSTTTGRPVSTASSTKTGKPVSTASTTTTGKPVSTASSTTTGKPVTLASSSTTETTSLTASTLSPPKAAELMSTTFSTTAAFKNVEPASMSALTSAPIEEPVPTPFFTTTADPVITKLPPETSPDPSAVTTLTGLLAKQALTTTIEPSTTNPFLTLAPTTTPTPVVTPTASLEWSSWTSCSASCGGGFRVRARKCRKTEAGVCFSDETQITLCNTVPCEKMIKTWSPWGPWRECTATCGGGARVRFRMCHNAQRFRVRSGCVGRSFDVRLCNTADCPTHVPVTSQETLSTTVTSTSSSSAKRKMSRKNGQTTSPVDETAVASAVDVTINKVFQGQSVRHVSIGSPGKPKISSLPSSTISTLRAGALIHSQTSMRSSASLPSSLTEVVKTSMGSSPSLRKTKSNLPLILMLPSSASVSVPTPTLSQVLSEVFLPFATTDQRINLPAALDTSISHRPMPYTAVAGFSREMTVNDNTQQPVPSMSFDTMDVKSTSTIQPGSKLTYGTIEPSGTLITQSLQSSESHLMPESSVDSLKTTQLPKISDFNIIASSSSAELEQVRSLTIEMPSSKEEFLVKGDTIAATNETSYMPMGTIQSQAKPATVFRNVATLLSETDIITTSVNEQRPSLTPQSRRGASFVKVTSIPKSNSLEDNLKLPIKPTPVLVQSETPTVNASEIIRSKVSSETRSLPVTIKTVNTISMVSLPLTYEARSLSRNTISRPIKLKISPITKSSSNSILKTLPTLSSSKATFSPATITATPSPREGNRIGNLATEKTVTLSLPQVENTAKSARTESSTGTNDTVSVPASTLGTTTLNPITVDISRSATLLPFSTAEMTGESSTYTITPVPIQSKEEGRQLAKPITSTVSYSTRMKIWPYTASNLSNITTEHVVLETTSKTHQTSKTITMPPIPERRPTTPATALSRTSDIGSSAEKRIAGTSRISVDFLTNITKALPATTSKRSRVLSSITPPRRVASPTRTFGLFSLSRVTETVSGFGAFALSPVTSRTLKIETKTNADLSSAATLDVMSMTVAETASPARARISSSPIEGLPSALATVKATTSQQTMATTTETSRSLAETMLGNFTASPAPISETTTQDRSSSTTASIITTPSTVSTATTRHVPKFAPTTAATNSRALATFFSLVAATNSTITSTITTVRTSASSTIISTVTTTRTSSSTTISKTIKAHSQRASYSEASVQPFTDVTVRTFKSIPTQAITSLHPSSSMTTSHPIEGAIATTATTTPRLTNISTLIATATFIETASSVVRPPPAISSDLTKTTTAAIKPVSITESRSFTPPQMITDVTTELPVISRKVVTEQKQALTSLPTAYTTSTPEKTSMASPKPTSISKATATSPALVPEPCLPCNPKQRRLLRGYCTSDIVLHAVISGESYVAGNRTVHYATVLSVFKTSQLIPQRIRIRVPGAKCPCPHLQARKDYIVMGHLSRNKKGDLRVTLSQKSFAKRWTEEIEMSLYGDRPDCTAFTPEPTQPMKATAGRTTTAVRFTNAPTKQPTSSVSCPPCPTAQANGLFCSSGYVLRIRVNKDHINANNKKMYRAYVKRVYKGLSKGHSDVLIRMSGAKCLCPRIQVGKEYVFMGKVRPGKRGQLRLVINRKSFVQEWSNSLETEMKGLGRSCRTPMASSPVVLVTSHGTPEVSTLPMTTIIPDVKTPVPTSYCPACRTSQNTEAQFCVNDHVLLVHINKFRSSEDRTIYYAKVLTSFKGDVTLPVEALIRVTGDKCPCPSLQVGKHYIVMGDLRTSAKGKSRMRLTDKNFVQKWSLGFNKKVGSMRENCGLPVAPRVPATIIDAENTNKACQECRPSDDIREFCFSKNVFRARVLTSSHTPASRLVIQVVMVAKYKGTIAVPLVTVRVPEGECACPRLVAGREYLLMGDIKLINKEKPRLTMDGKSFVREWHQKLEETLAEVNLKCEASSSIEELVVMPTGFIGVDNKLLNIDKSLNSEVDEKILSTTKPANQVIASASRGPMLRTPKYTIVEVESGFSERKAPKKEPAVGGKCPPCLTSRRRNRIFCTSDYVIKVKVHKRDNTTQHTIYHATVKFIFKLRKHIKLKIPIWVLNDKCNCPSLQVGKVYVIMGTFEELSTPRLVLSTESFVREWKKGLREKIEALRDSCTTEHRKL